MRSYVHYPQRWETHRTDTLAVRKVISALSADWVVRDVSERDYGIDLMFEYFRGIHPTGQIVFFQVKGTQARIEPNDGLVKFQLSKRTLAYAEQFSEPFFLVHASVDPNDPHVYFAWLQKYILLKLDKDKPKWRTDESIDSCSIHIPASNSFGSAQDKLVKIAGHAISVRQSLAFLSDFVFWEHAYLELESGNVSIAKECLARLERFGELHELLEHYAVDDEKLKEARDYLEVWDARSTDAARFMRDFHDELDMVKANIVSRREQEEFEAAELGEFPY